MGDNAFPYRRLTRTLRVPVGPTPQKITIPPNFIPSKCTSFYVYVAANCGVALLGSSNKPDGAPAVYEEVDPANPGWVWPPGHVAVYSTQLPVFMSTVALDGVQGLPAASGFLYMSWGIGT